MKLGWLLFLTLATPAQELRLSSASAAAGQAVAVELTLQSPAGKEPAGLAWDWILPKPPLKPSAEGPTLGEAARQAGKSIKCVPKPSRDSARQYTCILVGGKQKVQNGDIARFIFTIPPRTPSGSYAMAVENGTAVYTQGTGIHLESVRSAIMVVDRHKAR